MESWGRIMMKIYPATSIKEITSLVLVYVDEFDIQQSISLSQCRDNWYNHYFTRQSALDKLLHTKTKYKYVGDRLLNKDVSYFLFYSDPQIQFEIETNTNMDSSDFCEAIQYFDFIKEKLEVNGWITFDIG